ncbi:hypothetical protein FB562_1840 [Homoserinimonas aerilata]|uniref:TadE-like protein n=1 Tax=Homoserinimonas aerilata TaxID=1162970 RepID=A0A542YKX2_9MICO|nr:hypothetical protein FB562_1840 [Homoserinimonas aerilata]
MTLPAVAIVLTVCLASVQLGGQQMRLQDAAGGAARSIARGESHADARARFSSLLPGAHFDVRWQGELVCVDAGASGSGLLAALTVTAGACSLAGGG